MPPNVIAVKKQTEDHPLVYEMRCEKNFILEGSPVIHCNKEGIWDHDLPVCKMDVKTMVNDPPTVEKNIECDANAVAIDPKSGSVSFTKNSTIVGSKAILHCAEGYRPKGKAESECWPNGWSHIGNFEFACTFVECPNTYSIKNGFVQLLKPSKSFDRIHAGSVVSVHCNNDNHMFNKEVILRYCGVSGFWVKSEQQGDKSAKSDLDTICASSNSSIWKAYIFVAVITFGVCLIITAIVVISVILCRKKKRTDRHYQHHSPPSTVHSLAESSHLGYRYQQSENDYNSILYEDTYHLNNFNNAGTIIDNVRSGNRMYQYEYDLRSSKADHSENIYSEPMDAKVKNTENVIYS
ncbi:hypothetical protein B4U80_11921 [Leptotrombidium deliense]|uniref:Sushi domain-containing protein n=1 Tax=Leptotrombidium deliense TaxID=299467 RepID=A0A443S0T9_9ACAR|nr:hypothetical protein B4U80_11921 [Leptotrombidium deliense]